MGSATAEIEGVEGDEKGKVLAYICQKEGGKWRCGCGDTNCRNAKWQIQEYSEEESNTTTNDTVGDGELDVYAPSTYHVLPGEKVTLTGIGFDNPIDVLWNGEIKDNNLESRNKTTITTTVPNLPPGKYDIKVREGNTVSEYGTVIWIKTYGETQEPHITSITPSSGKQGDTFTIHGYGFTKENNDILTMFQEYEKVVSKNGTEMKFLFKPFEKDWKQYNESGERVSRQIPVQVTVVNTGGVSNYATFNLEL